MMIHSIEMMNIKKNYSEAASNADMFVCSSKHILDSFLSKYSVKNPVVIYNGGAQPIEGSRKFVTGISKNSIFWNIALRFY
jgi:hypothetical protein